MNEKSPYKWCNGEKTGINAVSIKGKKKRKLISIIPVSRKGNSLKNAREIKLFTSDKWTSITNTFSKKK